MSESSFQKAKRNDADDCLLSDPAGTGRKSPFENYNLPDRTYSDYYCKHCISHMNSREMWASHIQGKRHRKTVKNLEDSLTTDVDIHASNEVPVIEGKLVDINMPIVGLKYIAEIRKVNMLLGPTYKCFLCSANLATGDLLIDHLATPKHMLAYIKETDHNGYKLLQDFRFSKDTINSLIVDHASKLEQEHGRGVMTINYEKKNGVLPSPSEFQVYEATSSSPKNDQQDVQKPKRRRERSPQYESGDCDSSTKSSISLWDNSSRSGAHRSFRERSPNYSPPRTPERRKRRSTSDDENPYASPPCRDLREKLERAQKRKSPEMFHLTPSPREKRPKNDKYRWYRKGYKSRYSSRDTHSKRSKRDETPRSRERKLGLNSDDLKRQDVHDMLRKIRKSSPSATIKFLEKIAFNVTTDEECKRLEKMAKIIEASVIRNC